MNVTRLRELLQECEANGQGDLPVKFAYNYGDHWRTSVAQEVTSCMPAEVEYSEYHSMDKVIDEYEDDDCDVKPREGLRLVILLD